MPFVFDLAKARGYSTAFFTSSTLIWANFDKFFSSASIDKLFSADSTHEEIINDLNIDDQVAVQSAADWIDAQNGKLFVVLYLNSLHIPYQAKSAFRIPRRISDRRERAVFITEECHRVIFDVLKRKNRLDDAMIFSIGDHGETVIGENSIHGVRTIRFTNLTPQVLSPLFVIKVPHNIPSKNLENLNRNLSTLISNIDIAPSIADLLGVEPFGESLSYRGHSIFKEISSSRIVYTTNTNEWRSWPQSAVAISRGSTRVVVDYQSALLVDCSGEATDDVEFEELLFKSLSEKIIKTSISRIFRDRLGL